MLMYNDYTYEAYTFLPPPLRLVDMIISILFANHSFCVHQSLKLDHIKITSHTQCGFLIVSLLCPNINDGRALLLVMVVIFVTDNDLELSSRGLLIRQSPF